MDTCVNNNWPSKTTEIKRSQPASNMTKPSIRLFRCPHCLAVFTSREQCVNHKLKMHQKRSTDLAIGTKQKMVLLQRDCVKTVSSCNYMDKRKNLPSKAEDQKEKIDDLMSNANATSSAISDNNTVSGLRDLTSKTECEGSQGIIHHSVTTELTKFSNVYGLGQSKLKSESPEQTVQVIEQIDDSSISACANQGNSIGDSEVPFNSGEEEGQTTEHQSSDPQPHAASSVQDQAPIHQMNVPWTMPILIKPIVDEENEKDYNEIKCEICCHVFTTKQELLVHTEHHTDDCKAENISVYKNVPADSQTQMKMKEESPSTTEMEICTESVGNVDYFEKTSGIQCSICDGKYDNIIDYTNHLKVHSGSSDGNHNTDSDLDSYLTSRTEHCIIGHSVIYDGCKIQLIKCSHCAHTSKTKAGFMRHLKRHGEQGLRERERLQLTCMNCRMMFPSKYIYKSHYMSGHEFDGSHSGWTTRQVVVESVSKSHTCTICAGKFLDVKSLQRHMQSLHPRS